MKAIGILMVGTLALLASLAMACGSDEKTPAAGDTGAGTVSGGMIMPDQFLTYEGERYELVNILFENMLPAGEFTAVGLATETDVDLKGDMRVFNRTGDSTAVYTYSAPTADDGGMWLAWRLAS